MHSFLKLAGATFLFAGMLHAQSRITCSSNNGNRNECRADTSRGVTLLNQLSSAKCIQGRTWGWTDRGIWVDQGCRAEFALGRGGSGGYHGRPGGYPGGSGYSVQTLTCSSENGKRNWCGNPTNGEVRMIKQRSDSACREGYSWGTQPGSVWVDHGCRADFEIRARR